MERDDISDDKYGLFGPMFTEIGVTQRQHPDQLILGPRDVRFSVDPSRPIIRQEREGHRFQRLDRTGDATVVPKDLYPFATFRSSRPAPARDGT